MIYLYFDKVNKHLYAVDKLGDLRNIQMIKPIWDDVESVTADPDNGQIIAHTFNEGRIAEFPIGRTVLTCKKPIN